MLATSSDGPIIREVPVSARAAIFVVITKFPTDILGKLWVFICNFKNYSFQRLNYLPR